MKIVALVMVLIAASFPAGKATCPVDKKQFDTTDQTPKSAVNGKAVFFCADDCFKSFAREPEKHVDAASLGNCPLMKKKKAKVAANRRVVVNHTLWYVCCSDCAKGLPKAPAETVGTITDPITLKEFKAAADSPRSESNGQIYLFSTKEAKEAFDKEPDKYVVKFGS